MTALSPRRRRILSAVNAYCWRGHSPCHREIGKAVGLSSTSSVAHQLGVLLAGGWLAVTPGTNGTLRLGPRAAGSKSGVLAEVVPVAACATCGLMAPVDHGCGDVVLTNLIQFPTNPAADRNPPMHAAPLAIKESR